MKLLNNLLHSTQNQQALEDRRADVYRSLIHWEAKLGGELFGPVPVGTRREFVCLDEKTWLWHEEWNDATGHHTLTTRYDVRPDGIVKSQGSNDYQPLNAAETENLRSAIMTYSQRVLPELEGILIGMSELA